MHKTIFCTKFIMNSLIIPIFILLVSHFGFAMIAEDPSSNELPSFITVLSSSHPDSAIQDLFNELQNKAPGFAKLGEMYLVKDPAKKIKELVWSSSSPTRMNSTAAYRYCERLGASLPTMAQYEALKRAGVDKIVELSDKQFWTSTRSPRNKNFLSTFIRNLQRFQYVKYDNTLFVQCVKTRSLTEDSWIVEEKLRIEVVEEDWDILAYESDDDQLLLLESYDR